MQCTNDVLNGGAVAGFVRAGARDEQKEETGKRSHPLRNAAGRLFLSIPAYVCFATQIKSPKTTIGIIASIA